MNIKKMKEYISELYHKREMAEFALESAEMEIAAVNQLIDYKENELALHRASLPENVAHA